MASIPKIWPRPQSPSSGLGLKFGTFYTELYLFPRPWPWPRPRPLVSVSASSVWPRLTSLLCCSHKMTANGHRTLKTLCHCDVEYRIVQQNPKCTIRGLCLCAFTIDVKALVSKQNNLRKWTNYAWLVVLSACKSPLYGYFITSVDMTQRGLQPKPAAIDSEIKYKSISELVGLLFWRFRRTSQCKRSEHIWLSHAPCTLTQQLTRRFSSHQSRTGGGVLESVMCHQQQFRRDILNESLLYPSVKVR